MSCRGIWDADLGLVRLDVARGPHIKSMGVSIAGRRYLYPEEAIFLLDRDALRLDPPPPPTLRPHAYWTAHLSQTRSLTSAALAAYLYLRDRGFVVIRARQYDRQLALGEYRRALGAHFQRHRDGLAGDDERPPDAPVDLALTDADRPPMRFCCWLPDQCAAFRASTPSRPQFSVVAVSACDPVPDCRTIAAWTEARPDLQPLRVAVHELNHVAFVEFDDGPIPEAR